MSRYSLDGRGAVQRPPCECCSEGFGDVTVGTREAEDQRLVPAVVPRDRLAAPGLQARAVETRILSAPSSGALPTVASIATEACKDSSFPVVCHPNPPPGIRNILNLGYAFVLNICRN